MTPDAERAQAKPPLISIIPATGWQIQQTVNKIRSAQGEPISSTPPSQICESQPMEQSEEISRNFLSRHLQLVTRHIKRHPGSLPTHTEPHSEVYNSPHSSPLYKTPPSSPKNDLVSDLNDEDIQELNKNF